LRKSMAEEMREKDADRAAFLKRYESVYGKDATAKEVARGKRGEAALENYAAELIAARATRTSRILFVPDTHRPLHDERAWQLMLSAARGWKPDTIVILGDFADFASVSSHAKGDPRKRLDMEQELASVLVGLDELDALGATKRVYCSGNHEHRLRRTLGDKVPELYHSLTAAKMFKLAERGWEHSEYGETYRLGKLNITHDLGEAGQYAHMRAAATFGGCAVIGHVHSMGLSVVGNVKGERHVSASFGWLGSEKAGAAYMTRAKMRRNWTTGFGTGHMEANGTVHLQAHPIIANRVMVDGVLYDGSSNRKAA